MDKFKISLDLDDNPGVCYYPCKKPIALLIVIFKYTYQKLGKKIIDVAIKNKIAVCHIDSNIYPHSDSLTHILQHEKNKWISQYPVPWIWGCLGISSSLAYQLTDRWWKEGIKYSRMAFHFNPSSVSDFPSVLTRAPFHTLIWVEDNYHRKKYAWDLYHQIGNLPGKYQGKNYHTKLLNTLSVNYPNKQKYEFIASESIKKAINTLIYHLI